VTERCNDILTGDALPCAQLVVRGIERTVKRGPVGLVEVVAERL